AFPYGGAFRIAMGRPGPDDRLAVAARDQKPPLADRGGTKVAGAQLVPFDLVARLFQALDPVFKGLAGEFFDRLAILAARAPCDELLDVLHQDHIGLHLFRPFHHDPCKVADIAVARGAALGLAEMLAVRTGPE